jgi:hypothetical protein
MARLEDAKRAVAVVFGVNGFVFASWTTRLPAVRDILDLTPGRLGILLLAVSIGSVSTLLVAGLVVHRLGPRLACLGAATVMTGSMAGVGMTPAIPVLAGLLVLVGAGIAIWDVAMNVEGAGVERLLGRAIMPRFHAGFSLGTVAGAGVGAAAAALAVPLPWHLGIVSVLALAGVVVAVRWYVGPEVWGWRPVPTEPAAPRGRGSSGVLRAWREPRTLTIGLLALGMAFAEGSANDWLAVGLVDGYGVTHAVAALGFGVFVTAMTLARLAGPWTIERFGRVAALRFGALTVALGVLAVQAGSAIRGTAGLGVALVLATVGALAWGAGAALGFPVAMSAASDEPRYAAARVSVVSTIGYVAFLAGPPLLGLLGDHVGVIRALLGVGAAVLLSLAAAGAARPPAGVTQPEVEAGAGAS